MLRSFLLSMVFFGGAVASFCKVLELLSDLKEVTEGELIACVFLLLVFIPFTISVIILGIITLIYGYQIFE